MLLQTLQLHSVPTLNHISHRPITHVFSYITRTRFPCLH